MSTEEKKKNFYCVFRGGQDSLEGRVKDVVENFFLHLYTHWIIVEFWGY